MNGPEDHVHVPDFQQAPDNQEEAMPRVHEFVAAMRDAYEQNASIQVFQNLIQESPVVPAEAYCTLAFSFTSGDDPRLDVLPLLLQREPEIAKRKNNEGHLLLHRAIMSGQASIEVIQLILDANPDAILEKCGDGFSPPYLACEDSSAETVDPLVGAELYTVVRNSPGWYSAPNGLQIAKRTTGCSLARQACRD